ncbi:MAG: flippase-like domain-containing protein [Alphaproteobacteria bacterium]|nr:flippase-like domain-containing protein [Alphaproteobacteria bacterium]
MTDTSGVPTRASAKQAGFAIVKAAISFGLLYLLFQTYDIEAALRRVAGIELSGFFIAVALLLIAIVFAAWRWQIIVRALGASLQFRTVFSLVWIGMFFNQALPSNLGGDAVRIWIFYRQDGVLKRAIGSVLLDRVAALVGLALLALLTFPLAAQFIDDTAILAILAFLVTIIFVGLLALLWLDRFMVLFRRLLPSRLYLSITSLAEDSRIVLAPHRFGPHVLGLSIANQILMVLVMFALAKGLSIDVELLALLVLIPPVILASLLPISFAGWGIREGAMIAMLGTVSVPPENALVLSVAFGFLTLIMSLPGACVWLLSGNRKLPKDNSEHTEG